MAASSPDPYQTLGVAKSATADEIKGAYRNLAKKFHPDLNPGSKEAESRFKEINGAYEKVGTPEMRARFDRGEFDDAPPGGGFSGAGGTRGGAGARGGGGPFYRRTQSGAGDGGRYTHGFSEGFDEDLFGDLFGARTRGGEDQLYRMEVELRDAALGAEREITLPGGKRLRVKIPPGISDGARLRFAGQGGPGMNGAPAGDAYVQISVKPDPRFRQVGSDLECDLPISLDRAVFGGEVRVPTLEGAVMLKVPARSNSGARLRIAGKGIPDRATGKRGSQIVNLQIELPSTIDAEFEAALRALAERHPEADVGR